MDDLDLEFNEFVDGVRGVDLREPPKPAPVDKAYSKYKTKPAKNESAHTMGPSYWRWIPGQSSPMPPIQQAGPGYTLWYQETTERQRRKPTGEDPR